MKILVTGGAGFIGSHIVNKYIDAGYSVDIVDNLSTGQESNIDKRAEFYKMDILDPEIDVLVKDKKYDIINHHAAQINVRKSVEDPAFDIDINYKGSAKLIETAAKYGVNHFIFASSGGAVYGEQVEYPAGEDHPKNPICPYGINKLAVEYYLYYVRSVSDLNYTALRYSNVYGPRQNYESEAGVVAIFINRILENEEIFIFGNGEQTRDFVYVNDVADVNLLMADKKLNGCFNVCTSVESSVNDIFRELAEILDYTKKPTYLPPKDGELFRSSLSFKLLREKLNWTSEEKLSDGLRKTVEYFREIKN